MAPFDSNILAKRVIDALRMMYQGPLEQARDVRPSLPSEADHRIATVNLTGSPSYQITVAVTAQGGIALAQAMFECTAQAVTRLMIDDAMCELVNMTAGQVKGLIAQTHRINQRGVVRRDRLERNAKLVVGTCLRLPGATAEISILLAEIPVVSVDAVGTTIHAAGRKTDPFASRGLPAIVGSASLASSTPVGRGIAGGTSLEHGRNVEPIRAVESIGPVTQDALVELSAVTIDTPPEEIGSQVSQSLPDPVVAITAASSRDIGVDADAIAAVAAADTVVEARSIAPDLPANIVGGMAESEISAPAMIDAASKAFSAESSSTLSDTVGGQTAVDGEAEASATATATATEENISSAAGSDALGYSPPDSDVANEAPLAAEGTESAIYQSATVVEAAQSITSQVPSVPIDASIYVEDPAAAGALPEEYLSVSTSADSMAQEQFVSILATHAVDQPLTVRPTRRRGRQAGEDAQLRVMIAQRNEGHLKVIRRAVISRNMRLVAIARDGEEAVNEALRSKPDLLCLDLDLDKQDGLEALARIRSELPTLTVAVVSASVTMPQVRRAMELQVVSIIVRPLTHSRLTAELARIAPFTLPGNRQLRTHPDVSPTLTSDQLPSLQ